MQRLPHRKFLRALPKVAVGLTGSDQTILPIKFETAPVVDDSALLGAL